MSIVNYIVNLDELSNSISNSLKSEALFNLGSQRVKGFEIVVNNQDEQRVQWFSPTRIQILGIKFATNDCRNIGYEDTFDLYINGEKIFEDVYFKEVYEHKRFRQHRTVEKDEVIEFVFKNVDKKKTHVWFDIVYVDREIATKTIELKCIDTDTKDIIRTDTFFVMPPFKEAILAPQIDGYDIVGMNSVNVDVAIHDNRQFEFTFEYRKK